MRETLSEYWLSFVLVFGVGFGVSVVLTPLCIRLSQRFEIMAVPGGRRQHLHPIGKLGGLAIVIAFLVAIVVGKFTPIETTDPNEIIRLTGLVLGSVFITVVGIIDDKYELSAFQLYTAQIFTAAIAIFFLIFIESFNNPLTGSLADGWPYWLTVTITLFWLGFMMNTVNFLDGLDGLAAGVAAIASLLIFFHSTFQLNQVSVGLLPLALFGATLGFLIYNFYPSKIFMGSGAYFLGYALGTLSIIGGAKMATILLVMGLPLSDVGWQIVRRLSRGKNPMLGDRGHLHFRLVDMGYSQRKIVLGYYAFSLAFGGIALITTSRLFKFLSLLVMGIILVGTFVFVSWTASKKNNQNHINGISYTNH
jgi:UDP-GlcNAc:undecaprenyl-phosphate GlcNAc-1-phosphate transferase